ncbi:hypothetical protein ACVBIO_20495 [Shewanella sp. 0m-8]
MRHFSISRLSTSIGIVKLQGEIQQAKTITMTQFSIMGTDGWFELDLTHQDSQNLINQIQAEIVAHLTISLSSRAQ